MVDRFKVKLRPVAGFKVDADGVGTRTPWEKIDVDVVVDVIVRVLTEVMVSVRVAAPPAR
ncbi:MAG: hypothetical protein JRN09_09405 [Nitrososphaerota archaeon]|nr:hypothetical protein [Nitrososphaerota archaeon]